MSQIERRGFEVRLLQELPVLHRRALFLVRDADGAADLVQDTLEKALAGWRRFRPGTNLGAWLMVVMKNLHIDGCRRLRTRQWMDRQLGFLSEDVEEAPRETWQTVEPSQVPPLLEQLSAPIRKAVQMVVLERRSYQEAAIHMGVAVATVGTRLNRARLQLRALAHQQGGSNAEEVSGIRPAA